MVVTNDSPLLSPAAPMMVYDGSCAFCSRAVQFILRHEHRHDLLFVARDSQLGMNLREKFGLEQVESMLWIERGRAATESEAVLRSATYIGGMWALLGAIGSVFPAALRNWVYRLIARNRKRLSSGNAACLLPTPGQQARFLA